MSIIEKAAGRLDKARSEAPPPSPVKAPEVAATESAGAPLIASAAQTAGSTPQAGGSPQPATVQQVAGAPAGASVSAPAGKLGKQVEINLQHMHGLGMVTPEGGRTAAAEEFRMIKRPLLKAAFNREGAARHSNLIMITSSLPGEGKTFCSINLAMSIAMEMDHTVLLVDADVARPSVLRTLGLEQQPGLMDVLLDDSLDLADVMLRTNVDTLRILPAGKSHPNATELLASISMSTLLDQISKRYPDRIVIFDSPPLLLTSEAKVLASHMGQIVLVVEAETTTQHAVKDALRQLGATNNISLVYNKTKAFTGDSAYGYGYN